MSKSQKTQVNDLLPQRRSTLGRFILLAVVIHVAVAAFYFQLKARNPDDTPGIKVKPDKAVSKPVAKELMIASEATGIKRSMDMTAQRSPMHGEIHMAKPDLKRSAVTQLPLKVLYIAPASPPIHHLRHNCWGLILQNRSLMRLH